MLTTKRCYVGIALATLMLAAVPQVTNAVERLELEPAAICVTDPNGTVFVDIVLYDIDPNHPIMAANMNLAWDSTSCWQVETDDIFPGPGFDQFGSEECNPGEIIYGVTRSLGLPPVAPDPNGVVIARVRFTASVPPDGCCVETIALAPGSGASATKVAGLGGYESIPTLGAPQTIRIDQIAPEIFCKPDMLVSADPGVCTWTPGFGDIADPNMSDNCDPNCLVLTWERSDGALLLLAPYDVGETFITWTVTDCCGNTDSCVQRILVEDNEPPQIFPSSGTFVVPTDSNCLFELPDLVTWIPLLITDNCTPDPNIQQTEGPGTVYGPGEYDVVINANDSHGNNANAVFHFIVEDQTPPVFINPPDDIEVNADAGECSAMVQWAISAFDECGAVCLDCDPPSGTHFPAGATTPVTCTATNQAGLMETHVFNITVKSSWVMNVEVGLQGYVNMAPHNRCIDFEFADCDGALPMAPLQTVLTFVGGIGVGTLEIPDPPLSPCVPGAYTCARARDARASVWSRVEGPSYVYISGTEYYAVFLGDDALRLGNVDFDGDVDILDWIIWQGQFLGLDPIPTIDPNAPCDLPWDPYADVSGDGLVSAVDYGHLYVNAFAEDDSSCCAKSRSPGKIGSGAQWRISVAQLEAMGLGYAVEFDYNGDGYVDSYDANLPVPLPDPEPGHSGKPKPVKVPNPLHGGVQQQPRR